MIDRISRSQRGHERADFVIEIGGVIDEARHFEAQDVAKAGAQASEGDLGGVEADAESAGVSDKLQRAGHLTFSATGSNQQPGQDYLMDGASVNFAFNNAFILRLASGMEQGGG